MCSYGGAKIDVPPSPCRDRTGCRFLFPSPSPLTGVSWSLSLGRRRSTVFLQTGMMTAPSLYNFQVHFCVCVCDCLVVFLLNQHDTRIHFWVALKSWLLVVIIIWSVITSSTCLGKVAICCETQYLQCLVELLLDLRQWILGLCKVYVISTSSLLVRSVLIFPLLVILIATDLSRQQLTSPFFPICMHSNI